MAIFGIMVLEDWIYLYYLNRFYQFHGLLWFLRTEFICIIWTCIQANRWIQSSWGLNLFVLFELNATRPFPFRCSWGLNLFVLFEQFYSNHSQALCSWGLNLFVLFERMIATCGRIRVLEDWIYLYYLNVLFFYFLYGSVLEDWIYLYYLNLNQNKTWNKEFLRTEFICIIWTVCYWNVYFNWFLRTEFICIIWTEGLPGHVFLMFLRTEFICIIWTIWYRLYVNSPFLRTEFICIIWTIFSACWKRPGSWGLNLFVLFDNFLLAKILMVVLKEYFLVYYLILFILFNVNYHILTNTLCSYWETPSNKAWANDFCVGLNVSFP